MIPPLLPHYFVISHQSLMDKTISQTNHEIIYIYTLYIHTIHYTNSNSDIVGKNFLYVSIHEFGHALGLGHSNVAGAVMQPIINPYKPDQQLHEDDIRGIQQLYGKVQHVIKLGHHFYCFR